MQAQAIAETYNDKVVRQFAAATVICAHWPIENGPKRSLASRCLKVGWRTG